MKLAFVLLAIPLVAASIDSSSEIGTAHGDDYPVELLDAVAEGPFVLADLNGRNRVQPGYCYGAKDFNCYRNGYPKCCSQTKGNCPTNSKPGCEGYRQNPVGTSYCTYSPDYTCYQSGWPRCCNSANNLQCPTVKPMCDKGNPGFSYCAYAPNYNCYRNGWPACCLGNNGGYNCPTSKPGCNVDAIEEITADESLVEYNAAVSPDEMIPESAPEDLIDTAVEPVVSADLDGRNRDQPGYCYGRANYDCYRNGYPKCCSQTKGNCPVNNKPGCEGYRNNRDGSSYCTYAPNYRCYRKGWPNCCLNNNGASCPASKPSCNVDDVEEVEDETKESSEQGHFLRG